MWQLSSNSEKTFFDLFCKTFLTTWDKNEDGDKNIWENEFNFWILHIKTRLYKKFSWKSEKTIFDSLFKPFLTNRGKRENGDQKFGKMSLIFDLFISKLGYMAIFIRICLKNFVLFFRTFLTNWGKNEGKDKKNMGKCS